MNGSGRAPSATIAPMFEVAVGPAVEAVADARRKGVIDSGVA